MQRMGLIISIFFLVGFKMLITGLRSLFHGCQATTWLTVEGRILDSQPEENDCESAVWAVKIRYVYVVAGQSYEGDRIAFGYIESSNCGERRALSDELQCGSRVTVHYDPVRPDRSVLATDFAQPTLFTSIFATT